MFIYFVSSNQKQELFFRFAKFSPMMMMKIRILFGKSQEVEPARYRLIRMIFFVENFVGCKLQKPINKRAAG